MQTYRVVLRSGRAFLGASRQFSALSARYNEFDKFNKRGHDNVDVHRKSQTDRPLNPHLTNTTSTIANEFPSLGKDKPSPEMLSAADPEFTPQDSVPENTERMTGGTQKPGPDSGTNKELDVGEMEGATFRVEPLRRTGEDPETQRARLLCPLLQDTLHPYVMFRS
jgi:hypothetical protein